VFNAADFPDPYPQEVVQRALIERNLTVEHSLLDAQPIATGNIEMPVTSVTDHEDVDPAGTEDAAVKEAASA